jgi:hypothetical protein
MANAVPCLAQTGRIAFGTIFAQANGVPEKNKKIFFKGLTGKMPMLE